MNFLNKPPNTENKKRRNAVAVSLLAEKQPAVASGYAWLVSESSQHQYFDLDPDLECGEADVLDNFDELVAASIVARLRPPNAEWSLRATGEVVLEVLEQVKLLDTASLSVPARELVQRAHGIARQIVPVRAWNGGK
jgi:hypothetical protein